MLKRIIFLALGVAALSMPIKAVGQQPVQWRYSFDENGVATATYPGNVETPASVTESVFTQLPPAQVDTTWGVVTPDNGTKLAAGNTLAYCPPASCVPITTGGVVHRVASALFNAVSQYDGQAEEDTLAIVTRINKGYTTPLSRSTPYTTGANANIGNAVYRALTTGVTAAGSPPPGTRPVSFPYTYVDGGVTWLWINDSAVNAKASFYNEVINSAGGGASWAQANNFELVAGHIPTFNVNTELDFTNNSGTNCIAGTANCIGLFIAMGGGNQSTSAINIEGNGAGAIFGSRTVGAFSHALVSLDGTSARAIGVGTFTAATYSVAAIDDTSTAPAGLSIAGNKSFADIALGGTAPTGLAFTGTFTNQISGTGFSITAAGAYKMTPTTVAGLGTCNAGKTGELRSVTDANAPTYNGTLTGGGALSALAYCNGLSWTAH